MPRCLCRRRPRLLPRRMMALLLLPRRPLAVMACGTGIGTVGTPTLTIHVRTPTATLTAIGSTARASTPIAQRSGTTSPLMSTTPCFENRRTRAASTARATRARLRDPLNPTTDQARDQDLVEAASLNGPTVFVRPGLRALHQRGTLQRLQHLQKHDPKRETTGAGKADGIKETAIVGGEDPHGRHAHGPADASPERQDEIHSGLRPGSRGGGERRVPSAHRTITGQVCFALRLVVLYVQRCACVGLKGSYGPRRGGSKSTPLRLL